MSKRSDGLLADMLGNRWNVTHAPAAGATVIASVGTPPDGHGIHHLSNLSFSIRNMAAAAHTVTTQVRDASVAGTVLWSLDLVVAAAASKEVVVDNLEIEASKGKQMHFTQDTVLASVKATVNATGWTESSTDY